MSGNASSIVAGAAVSALLLAIGLLTAAWQIDEHFVTRREFVREMNRVQQDLTQVQQDLVAIRQELGIPRRQP